MRRYRRRGIFGEALRALGALKGQAVAAVLAIVAVMLICGALIMVETNVVSAVNQLGMPIRMTLYAAEEASEETVRDEAAKLAKSKGVIEAKYVSKEQALENMKKDMAEDEALLEGYTEEKNPLPLSIELKIDDRDVAAKLYNTYQSTDWVEDILYEKEIIEKLESVGRNLGFATIVMGGVLLLIGLLVVWNVVNLAVQAQRHEQVLLRQLGASGWDVVMPYCAMGGLIGAIGAALSAGLLTGAYALIVRMIGQITIPIVPITVGDMGGLLFGSLIVLGILFGAAAGALAVRHRAAGSRTLRIKRMEQGEVSA